MTNTEMVPLQHTGGATPRHDDSDSDPRRYDKYTPFVFQSRSTKPCCSTSLLPPLLLAPLPRHRAGRRRATALPIELLPPQIPVAPVTPPPGNGNKIAKAVAATAASTLVVTGLDFALFIVAKIRRREKTVAAGNVDGGSVDGGEGGGAGRPLPLQSQSNFVRYQGDVKGIIVDGNGLDVLYWRKLKRS